MPAAVSRSLSAVCLSLALASTAAAAPRAIEDDYPGALSEAKRLGVPILVDVWAPW